jgi:hypothetical protein
MRLHRPVLVALALGTVLPVSAASAATGVAAAGSAVSSANLATVSVGSLTVLGTTLSGHTVTLGSLQSVAQTLSSDAPAVSFAPAVVDGVKKGEVTVTPATSPKTVGGLAIPALPLNVISATSPSATLTAAKAATGPVSGLTTSLGQISVLGMPLTLTGGLKVGSATDAAKSQAAKTLTISDVSLPNLSDLLAALGIDLKKLPVDTLNGLVESLPVVISGTADAAIDAANGVVDTAQTTYDTEVTEHAAAATALATATDALDDALAATTIPVGVTLPAGMSAPLDHVDWDELRSTVDGTAIATAIAAADSAIPTAVTAYDAAKAAMPAAISQLNTALNALHAAISSLAGLVDGVLASNPLVSIDAAQIGTSAVAGATKNAAVTGYVSGVKVLGQDVLAAVTGNTKVDVAAISATLANQVNTALAGVTGTLSTVLSTATGATGLVVPAPSIKVMQKSTQTGTDGAFGTAQALVTALQVDLGSVTVPDAFALVGAGALPGVLDAGSSFKTAPLSFKVGVLGESARFRPGSATPPQKPGNGQSHPATGAPAALGIIAVIGTALAFGARRMARTES